MRTITIITLFLFVCFGIVAQQANQRREILTELNSVSQGRGRVTVYEDERIANVLGRPMPSNRPITTAADGSQFYEFQGFKIQAYTGSEQRASRTEAEQRERIIRTAFPDHEPHVFFVSPFWRLRVGNFATRDEAEEVMHEMRRRFPSFGRELTVVSDVVRIPVR